MTPQLIEALAFVARGWAVFPHRPHQDFAPLTEHGFKDASTARGQVLTWWERWEGASIGIATGSTSGILVLDVDPRHDGDKSLRTLIEKHGELPSTYTVRSGGGGWHYYFEMPTGMSIQSKTDALGRGLDIKADGGCITGATSIHASGAAYIVENNAEVAPLPPWLLQLVAPPKTNGNGYSNGHAKRIEAAIIEGSRNATLAKFAGSMRRPGMSQDAIVQALLVENAKHCDPPLPEEEVRRIATSIARYEPAPLHAVGKQPSVSLLPYHFTDTGNAERLYARCGENIRWVKNWKKWATWTPPKWDPDGTLTVMGFAKRMVRALYREAGDLAQGASTTEHDEQRERQAKIAEATIKFALKSEESKSLNAMVTLLKDHVFVEPDIFDADRWILNCNNGTIDLKTGQLGPHRREDFLTKIVPIDFDPDATCHQWEDFLESIFAGNQELISWIQKAVGYTLTGLTQEQVFFLCHGVGSNGKSTFLRVVASLLGEYGESASFQTFTHTESQMIRNDLAALRAARFVSAIESSAGQRLSDNTLKAASGGDKVTCRFLYGEVFSYIPQYKIWLATNHRPKISDTTHAMWRRVCLIPFTIVIADEDQDHDLDNKLAKELPGILAWAVRGCVRWCEEGLKPFPTIVQSATQDYREESDMVQEFIQEECLVQSGLSAPSSMLYAAFCKWSETQGEKKPMSIASFGASLTEKKFKVERSALTRRKVRLGIGLRVVDTEEQ